MPGEFLWLTTLEAAEPSSWPPTLESGWRVAITASPTLLGCAYAAPYRTSPIFPISADFEVPNLDEEQYLHFACFDPAFPILGRLLRTAPQDIKKRLFYTLGLASVVLIHKDADAIDKIIEIVGTSPRATEIWHVKGSRIQQTSCRCGAAAVIDPLLFKILSYDSLPLVSKTAVDEFVASISLLLPKIAIHLPLELPTFQSLIGLVNELVGEMNFVSNPVGEPPSSLSEYRPEEFRNDLLLSEMVLHQATDRLVQINAALSYLSTQALSGAVPILERRSLIRRHSLLGVGSATLALTRIARAIENAFASAPLERILTERAIDAPPLPGISRLPNYDSSEWSSHSVNRWEARIEPRDPYPKLPYFSGRLGFRESEYTISAALHSLAAGADPEWSLLTLTHEMVHGHVRNILSVVFQGDAQRIPDNKWKEFYEKYESLVKSHSDKGQNLVDSVRAILLAYCGLTITHGSLTREGTDIRKREHPDDDVKLKFMLPGEPEALWLVLEGELRNISEILVHVLDLHYFYYSRLSAYIPLIWSSWSTLPQVRGDLRQYVLRSLLVVASKTKGRAYQRLEQARLRLVEMLRPLIGWLPVGAPTIRSAVQLLENEDEMRKLVYPFNASLMLVDLANDVLTSNSIRGALTAGDPHLKPKRDETNFEEWLEYDLPDEFVDDTVAAPTAFLADRLARKLFSKNPKAPESETARLFLACSSNVKRGGYDEK